MKLKDELDMIERKKRGITPPAPTPCWEWVCHLFKDAMEKNDVLEYITIIFKGDRYIVKIDDEIRDVGKNIFKKEELEICEHIACYHDICSGKDQNAITFTYRLI